MAGAAEDAGEWIAGAAEDGCVFLESGGVGEAKETKGAKAEADSSPVFARWETSKPTCVSLCTSPSWEFCKRG